MKKLIAMIGAVAMAFGLYADVPEPAYAPYSTSFESEDPGVSEKTWTAPIDWTTTQTEAFTLGDQLPKEQLPYATGRDRRDDLFKGLAVNNNFLKLETGTNTLSHGIDVGQVYFDQLVKFTGYEEAPEIAADAKIAVWLSAIDADDQADPVEEGSTNLYVSVGDGNGVTKKVQVAGDFEVDKWYRVTIKSIGDVSSGLTSQLGFQLFIDGQAASIVADDKDYNINYESFNDKAAALYAKGQLFTAIDMSNLALTTVAYQGIGGVDDIIFSKDAPDFDQFVEIAIADLVPEKLTGAKVIKIGDVDIIDQKTIEVKPGDILVNYAANGPYIVKNGEGVKWTVSADGTLVMDKDAKITVVEAVAQIGTDLFESLAETLAAVQELEKTEDEVEVSILKDVEEEFEEAEVTVGFAAESTIVIAKGGIWAVEGNATFIGNIGEAGLAKAVTVDGKLAYAGTISAGSSIVATTIDTTLEDQAIVLEADASITTTTDISAIVSAAEELPAGYKLKPTTLEEGYTKWAVVKDGGFMVIISGVPGETFETLQEAVNAAPAGATIQLLKDAEIPALVAIERNLTVDLNGFTLARANDAAKVQKLFEISEGATLTVNANGGTAYGRLATVGKQFQKDGVTKNNPGNLVVNGGTYVAGDTQTAIHVNGDCSNCSVSINNASIESTGDNGVQFNGAGTFEVVNSTIKGYTAIYMKAGTLSIDETSKIIATGTTAKPVTGHTNGANATGDAIVLDSSSAYKGNVTLNIADGATVSTADIDGVYAIRETVTKGDVSTTLEINAPSIADIALSSDFAAKVAAGKAQLPGFVAIAGTTPYTTLAAAVEAATTADTVTLIDDITLTATLELAKTTTIDLNGKTVTFGDGLKNGIVTTAAAEGSTITIGNGSFDVAGTRPAGGFAFQLYRVNALFQDVEMDLEGFEYGLEAETMLTDKADYWDVDPYYVITCKNVKIEGNGSLFHFENVIANLDTDCVARQTGTPFGGAHNAAIYSSCGAVVTVNGGYYKAVNALQTGNLGGDIIVKKGVFDGNIKSWMLDDDTRDFADSNEATITIEDGVFTGNFVYADGCSAASPLLTVEISDGDFSDKNIPTAFIKPVEHKVAKWVDSTLAGYVTPGYDWEKLTLTVPKVEHAEVEVKYGETTDTTNGVYTLAYDTYYLVKYTPDAGYEGEQKFNGNLAADYTLPVLPVKAIEYKYSFAKAGGEQGDDIADITYTVETEATLKAPACNWTLEGFEFAGWTNTVKGGAVIAAGATLEKVLENTELTAAWNQKQQGWPEEGDPTIIDKKASEAFEGKIPEALADVPAQKFTTWAKKAGLDFATCKPADVDVDAYLLDCTPDEVVAEKAKAVSAIEITSITFDGEKWVITSGTYSENSAYGANAKVHFEEVTIEGADTTNAKFWQATLVPDTTPAND